MSNAYGTEVKQSRGSRKKQQTNQKINPREEPNSKTPHDSLGRHLATVCCEQCQLNGRVAAHSGHFTVNHKEHQAVDDGQEGNCDDGDSEKGDCAPRTFLASSQREEEADADQHGGQLVVAEGVQEHIWGGKLCAVNLGALSKLPIVCIVKQLPVSPGKSPPGPSRRLATTPLVYSNSRIVINKYAPEQNPGEINRLPNHTDIVRRSIVTRNAYLETRSVSCHRCVCLLKRSVSCRSPHC